MTPDVLLLVGPTASGKSAVAYELARRLAGEIISADSMQVYRGVPLLTQQPPTAWRQTIPHHLVGVRALDASWSAADFHVEALQLIGEMRQRSRLPIVVGGTGLYVRALVDGLCEAPAAQPAIRSRLLEEAAQQGSDAVHQRLAAVDPVAAGRIHPHDVRRIVRALEVYEATRTPLSRAWATQLREPFPYTFVMIGLNHPRAVLYDRINARVTQMFADGVVEEVRALATPPLSRTAQQILGLTAIREHLAGRATLDATIQLVQRQTRHYARRQLTWFRKDRRIHWIACERKSAADIADQIIHDVLA